MSQQTEDSVVKVYYASVCSNTEMRKKQAYVMSQLDMAKVAYEKVDITTDVAVKTEMRKIANNDTAIPPQIVVGDKYCGGYDAFFEAVEEKKIAEFLGH